MFTTLVAINGKKTSTVHSVFKLPIIPKGPFPVQDIPFSFIYHIYILEALKGVPAPTQAMQVVFFLLFQLLISGKKSSDL
jgi:hypothetical protein